MSPAGPAEACIDAHNHLGVDLLFYLRGHFPYAQSWTGLLTDARRSGVSHLVVFPMVSYKALEHAELPQETADHGAGASVPYAFENRRMLDEIYRLVPYASFRALPFLMVDPLRRCKEQAIAIRSLLAEHRIYGLKIQPTILQAPIRSLRQEGQILLELAAEHDLPWIIHSSIDPADRWSQCSDILNISEAWPQLRFCLAHSCRFDRPSLDRLNDLPNTWFDCSAHGVHCEAARQDLAVVAPPARRFESNYGDPSQVLGDLAAAYPGKMLWGSDSPFYSYADESIQLHSSYAAEAGYLRALPAPVQREIALLNSLKFLRLDHVDLRSQP